MNILLLGAPGAGKGTQAKEISEKFLIPIISMGDMLREMIKLDEELKEKVVPYMESGKLVPDEIVGEILKKRVMREDCKGGFILDGFPRNESQAKLLGDFGIEIDKVIEIAVPDEEILNRILGRRVCEKCGSIYHIKYKKPAREGICDECQGELKIRKDDRIEIVEERLKVYHDQTEPLKRYYSKKGKFFVVDGLKSFEEVRKMLLKVVDKKND